MTVLVCYLPTPEGDAAFDAGVAEAARRGEPVVVVNSPRSKQLVDAHLADDETRTRLVARGAEAGVEVSWRRDEHADDLAETVIAVAEDVDASVIVIGLRRRSPVGKLLMGSTAQRILLQSARPVLSVKSSA